LALHPDKTRLIRFVRHAAEQRASAGAGKPERFDFLGFSHFCTRSRTWAHFSSGRKTIKKRMRAKLEALKVELRKRMHDPITKTGEWVQQMLQGHLNYDAVSGNHPSLWRFCNQVMWLWLKVLKHRGQKAHLSWERFLRLVDRFAADHDQAGRVWSVRAATRGQMGQEPPRNGLLRSDARPSGIRLLPRAWDMESPGYPHRAPSSPAS
jgi:hypothetical protein